MVFLGGLWMALLGCILGGLFGCLFLGVILEVCFGIFSIFFTVLYFSVQFDNF